MKIIKSKLMNYLKDLDINKKRELINNISNLTSDINVYDNFKTYSDFEYNEAFNNYLDVIVNWLSDNVDYWDYYVCYNILNIDL